MMSHWDPPLTPKWLCRSSASASDTAVQETKTMAACPIMARPSVPGGVLHTPGLHLSNRNRRGRTTIFFEDCVSGAPVNAAASHEVTGLLRAWEMGQSTTMDELFPRACIGSRGGWHGGTCTVAFSHDLAGRRRHKPDRLGGNRNNRTEWSGPPPSVTLSV